MQPPGKRSKGLYESFVSSREDREDSRDRERDRERPWERTERRRRIERNDPPKKGNTVYVYGLGVNEDIIRKPFSSIGKIVHISMEMDKRY